jgi:hypothetical protein
MLKFFAIVAIAAGTPSPVPAPLRPLPDATSAIRGAVSTQPQTWSGTKKQIDSTLQGSPARSLLGVEVSVLDFGADPTGVADSEPAVLAAINSFSASGNSFCGTVAFPHGTYRFAQSLHVKKHCHLRGFGGLGSTVIAPDPGITPFYFERYNTPLGTTDSASGDNASISDLMIYNAAGHKLAIWTTGTHYNVGDRRKVGVNPHSGAVPMSVANNNEYYRHYEATTAGTSAGSGVGPLGLGADYYLAYASQSANFTRGKYVSGATSGASGILTVDTDNGTSGTLRLTSVSGGTFVNGETLTDGVGGSATASGTAALANDDEIDGSVRWKYIGPGAGLYIRANAVTARDMAIAFMSGNGAHIVGGDVELPSLFANANKWHFDNVSIESCDGHGLYVRGSDTNGGLMHGGIMGANGGAASDEDWSGSGFNIFDASFLGNTYEAVQLTTVAGQGNIYSVSIGGASTFTGMYTEGDGGGLNIITNGTIVGGGLSVADTRGTGGPLWQPSSVRIVGSVGDQASHAIIAALTGPTWRASVFRPVGVHCSNDSGKVYAVITAGTSASSGGPTGTGSDIVDGSIHWAYLGQFQAPGTINLGSVDPTVEGIMGWQAPQDVSVGFGTVLRYEPNAGPVTDAACTRYGSSGPCPGCAGYEGDGLSQCVGQNHSLFPAWPMKFPAGKQYFEQVWIGEVPLRQASSTSASDPSAGIWNPGDKLWYAGAAVSAGGSLGKICVTGGSAGPYLGGRTATCSGSAPSCTLSGAVESSLWDQWGIKVGDYVKINGGATRHVISASSDGLTLGLDGTPPLCNACSIAFVAPVFKTFGSISN